MRVATFLITCFSVSLATGQPLPPAEDVASTTVASTTIAPTVANPSGLSKRGPPVPTVPSSLMPGLGWDTNHLPTAASRRVEQSAEFWDGRTHKGLTSIGKEQGIARVAEDPHRPYAEVTLNDRHQGSKIVKVDTKGEVTKVKPKWYDVQGQAGRVVHYAKTKGWFPHN